MTVAQWQEPKTRNITTLFRTATLEQINEWRDWYVDAEELAVSLAYTNHLSTLKVAGIIAALSPLNSWGNNINLTVKFLRSHGTKDDGYLSGGLEKARLIYNLPDDGMLFPEIMRILNGAKTKNFFVSIATAGRGGVCVDRHAYSLAIRKRLTDKQFPTLTPTRYDQCVTVYTRAAKILSKEYRSQTDREFTPAEVQAITWKLWRNLHWSEGAFDGDTNTHKNAYVSPEGDHSMLA